MHQQLVIHRKKSSIIDTRVRVQSLDVSTDISITDPL
jgi:hypothetical protein